MVTPIERAARALCALDGHPENAMMDGKPLWQDYLPEARAVLQAIREPSEGMVEACCDAMLDHGVDIFLDGREVRPTWQAMIDAALENPPSPDLISPNGTYDLADPDCEDIVIQLKKGRTVVMTICDEDGVAQFGLREAVNLRDWLNDAVSIMARSAALEE